MASTRGVSSTSVAMHKSMKELSRFLDHLLAVRYGCWQFTEQSLTGLPVIDLSLPIILQLVSVCWSGQ